MKSFTFSSRTVEVIEIEKPTFVFKVSLRFWPLPLTEGNVINNRIMVMCLKIMA